MSSNVATRPTLSTAVLARSTWLSEAILLGAGVLLVALSAQVTFHLPNTPVPISGQTFAVLLVGSAYGAWRGLATIVALPRRRHRRPAGVLERLVGLGAGLGATGGYLVGMLVAAGFVGYLAERGLDRKVSSAVASMLTGNVVIYRSGSPGSTTSCRTPRSRRR